MPSPFPGMDPYLEDPAIWTGVHAALLAGIFERLGPAVRPKYAVRYEERVYVMSEDDPAYRLVVPDVRVVERWSARPATALTRPPGPAGALVIAEPIPVAELADEVIHEKRLQVIDVRDRSIVTVIEMLSPTNKVLSSAGRASFLQKRRKVLASDAHWMEIDLLRGGVRTVNPPNAPATEYQVYLSRAGEPRQGYVWPIPLRQRLPVIGVPLRGADPDVPLDLQAVLDAAVERGSYDLDIDYAKEPVPPLEGDAAAWAKQWLLSKGVGR